MGREKEVLTGLKSNLFYYFHERIALLQYDLEAYIKQVISTLNFLLMHIVTMYIIVNINCLFIQYKIMTFCQPELAKG
jgi:hypothetical protein